MRFVIRIALAAAAFGMGGCSQTYTHHMSETYKDSKLDKVRFGVVAMPTMEYNPPSSCFGGGSNDADAEKYRMEWERELVKSLGTSFPKQKFISIPLTQLDELGIKSESFFSRAETDIVKMGVEQYEVQGGQEKPLIYKAAQRDPEMQTWGSKIRAADSVDFIIALVTPKMTGETHSNGGGMMMGPMPGGGGGMMMGGGGGTSTSYTADARFGIWSAETGEIAYASGSISSSGGFCIFQSPQSGSISTYSGDMAQRLKELITAFLQRLPADAAGASAAVQVPSDSRAQ
ncbi:MAG: hypothetical protein JF616_02165 [Fibrobacteres bacterium]|nr:hypothetical protein [Fibrobacterota bacterium]